ncbi:MAG: group 1 truncated hemoglobin [Acidobacteriota bacterium]|nr:group 1 truncated hemoglobin [Blastocatellia bacterium]MDW8239256.1 group 1 truncated hemoglobin [Acidobacteriota bacterium]
MKKSHVLFATLLSLGVCVSVFAQMGAKMKEKSLYERLGGKPAITAVVDDFVARAGSNMQVNFMRDGKFANVDMNRLKMQLVDFICQATGGPERYTGRNMKQAHKGMKITNAEFDAIAADLAASLDKFKVPAKEKNELLAIVESTRRDIVEKK